MYSSNFLNSNDFKTIVVKLNYMLINFELANQRARKVLCTCVVYTNNGYETIILGTIHKVNYEHDIPSSRAKK